MERCTLTGRLAIELPHELRFIIHHLSTPPSECPALFSPPPNQDPDQTRCESHFLSVSIDHDGSRLQAFALEVLVYTTSDLTTVFVSKADSTGYLHLLELPKGQPSPLRTVVWTFLSHLIESRRRPGVRLVLSLFARAQDQYLFPGSIENIQKHVLDDRGLIRWWCKILDQVLRKYPAESSKAPKVTAGEDVYQEIQSRGYLKVPGCDIHETKAFFPESVRREQGNPRWIPKDPLRTLGKSPCVPERCLIPRFPDDPKARLVVDLDDELPENQLQAQDSPSKTQGPGKWRSVKSMEQFWEMMAFRQECAAGRLVGFIWGVFTPLDLLRYPYINQMKSFQSSIKNGKSDVALPTPIHSQSEEIISSPPSPLRSKARTGSPISPPSPSHILPPEDSQDVLPTSSNSPPESSDPILGDLLQTYPASLHPTADGSTHPSTYNLPGTCHGEIILPEADYQKISTLLLTLDYADKISAAISTQTWINAIAKAAGLTDQSWGQIVVGQKSVAVSIPRFISVESGAALLNTTLVRKKKRPNGAVVNGVDESGDGRDGGVKVLAEGYVRKKAKICNP